MHRTLRTPSICSTVTFALTLFATVLATGAPLLAQDPAPVQVPPAPPRTHWRGSVDANGTILYGAASQRIFTSGANASFMDPGFELRFDAQGGYGDSRNQDTGVRSVIARNMRLSSAFDWRPHNRTSPFAFASAETNYQQRYKSRVSGGLGVKQTFWRPDTVREGFTEDLSLSLAMLGEHTQLRDDAPAASQSAAGSRLRYSLRARLRKRINGNVRFAHVTLYQPTANDLSRYTLDAFTELAIPVRTRLQFTVTHRERLDSEAERRGAVSIRDGQVLFGLRATF